MLPVHRCDARLNLRKRILGPGSGPEPHPLARNPIGLVFRGHVSGHLSEISQKIGCAEPKSITER